VDGQREKPVVVVSSIHKGEDITVVKRKNNVGIREDVKFPKSIADYNKYMGVVDHFDPFLECYKYNLEVLKMVDEALLLFL